MNLGVSIKYYYLLAAEGVSFRRAIRVSIFVGIILNLINNPGILSSPGIQDFHLGRVLLTFIVPFGVSMYSSILSNSSLKPGNISQVDALLECKSCKQADFSVNVGQQIDECPQCKEKTRWKLSKILSSVHSGNDILKSLALFARHNPQPLFRVDVNGIILGANPAAKAMLDDRNCLGEKLESMVPEVQGLNYKELIDLEEVKDILITKKQRHYNFLLKGVPKLKTAHAYGNDITEIVLAERKIKIQAKEINDSIQYAWRIQKSLLPGDAFMTKFFPSNFVFYRPRNIVSGDFYWVNQVGDYKIIAVADSTGHGVPGAFMSMLGISLLNDIILREKIVEPDIILGELRKRLIFSLSLNQDDYEMNDGMDIALVAIHCKENTLAFSGAYNPLLICREGKLIVHNGDRMPVGKFIGGMHPFSVKKDKVKKNDRIYLLSDGYEDQFGGEKDKKFSKRRFKELLIQTDHYSLEKVSNAIQEEFDAWKQDSSQVDDVLVLGIEFNEDHL